ncbi:peptidase inhibitor family I36 protein [Streptomyces sp. NPDC053513]|uniref:peptidase inhibitor family I36 protein n=1 Tax=unclassified Streptomyces TaxID=2593676 RepID=UPI0037D51812
MAEQSSSRTRGWAKVFTALLMAVLALVAAPSAAGAATGGGEFAAQARAAGLTGAQAKSLQERVDGYLAKVHGTQIGANKIAVPGGELLLALPGEEHARDLGSKDAGVGVLAGCPYTYVCAYSGENFGGDELRLFTCNYPVRIYWNTTGSWINNQRSTLYARFYDRDGIVRWTSPGGYSEDRHADWRWVWWLSPC